MSEDIISVRYDCFRTVDPMRFNIRLWYLVSKRLECRLQSENKASKNIRWK